jgi:NADPH:quinone reductase-like Zn-dependent oxidoreductase
MRALRIHGYGGPEVMRLEDVPAPSAGPAQLLVKVAAASVNPIDWKMRLGAERVIDYRVENFADAGPYDAVLDTLGGEAHVRSVAALKPGGVLIALSATPVPPHVPRPGVRVEKPLIQATRQRLEKIFDWAVRGKLKAQVAQTFALEEAAKVYAACEAGHGRGKIVLQIS